MTVIGTLFTPGCIEPNAVTYQVTFNATWSKELHPDDFPSSLYFSGLIGASPNEPTDPPVSIFKIEGYPFYYHGELVPLGTFCSTKI